MKSPVTAHMMPTKVARITLINPFGIITWLSKFCGIVVAMFPLSPIGLCLGDGQPALC